MPGTIQVSVLDFMGLQTSTPPLQICLKISMGKREYQTWDKGDFSFPLMTLRDNLIVTLQDAEGNAISHTGVETRLVVEKGLWHDFFPLEGGGYVHMKLQFVLSEDERHRIRIMRESALKKKHGEFMNISLRSPESTTTVRSDVASSLSLNHEVPGLILLIPYKLYKISKQKRKMKRTCNETNLYFFNVITLSFLKGSFLDVQSAPSSNYLRKKCFLQFEAVSGKEVASHAGLVSVPFSQDAKSGTENMKGFYPDQDQINPNDTDRNEETSTTTPISQGVDVRQTEFSPKKIEARTSPADVPERITCSEETSSLLGCSDSVVATKGNSLLLKLEEDGAHNPKKQGPLEKTPSNVRKMISAFESSPAQDMRPQIKPPPTKSQSSKITMEAHLERPRLNEVNMEKDSPAKPISGTVKEPFLTGELQQASTNNRGGARSGFSRALGWVKSSQDSGQMELRAEISNLKNKSKVIHREVDAKEERKFREDLMRTLTAETATVSGRMLDAHSDSGRHQPCTFIIDERDSGGKLEVRGSGISLKDSQEVNIRGASNNRLKSETYWKDISYSFQRSDTWIFPDEARCLCVTTGSKLLMDLMGGCRSEEKTYQGQMTLHATENVEEHRVHGGTDNEVYKIPKSSRKLRKSKLENSADDETSRGPVGQAIKVAIMVGFGTLVLLTRQRKSRSK